MYPDAITDMSSLASYLGYFFQQIFVDSFYYHFMARFVSFIISEPLIMAVIAMFFAGFIVSIFIRIYHTA